VLLAAIVSFARSLREWGEQKCEVLNAKSLVANQAKAVFNSAFFMKS
jgi:hypothetical protein